MAACRRSRRTGSCSTSSTAILNYLEATRPSPPLALADARGRALVDMHMKLCDLQLSRHAGTIVFPKRFLPKEKWNHVAMAEAKGEIENVVVSACAASSSRTVAGRLATAAANSASASTSFAPALAAMYSTSSAARRKLTGRNTEMAGGKRKLEKGRAVLHHHGNDVVGADSLRRKVARGSLDAPR